VHEIDTVCAFAVLDGVEDFSKTMSNMKIIAKKNIVILTGLNIPADEFHTFNLKYNDFINEFMGWDMTVYEEIEPKVWLFEFTKR
jgi:hypothetical protein